MKKIIYLLLSIIVIYFVALIVIGFVAQKSVSEKIAEFNTNNTQYHIALDEYNKSIFGATANIKISNKNTRYDAAPYQMPNNLTFKIIHGPIIWDDKLEFKIIKAISNITFQDIIKDQVYPYFKESLANQNFAKLSYSHDVLNQNVKLDILKNQLSSANFSLSYDDIVIAVDNIKPNIAKNIDIIIKTINIKDKNNTIDIKDIQAQINLKYKYNQRFIKNLNINTQDININTDKIRESFLAKASLKTDEKADDIVDFITDLSIISKTKKHKLNLSINLNHLNLQSLLRIDELNAEQKRLMLSLYIPQTDQNATAIKINNTNKQILNALNKMATTNVSNINIMSHYLEETGIFTTNTTLTYKLDSLGETIQEFAKLRQNPNLFWDIFTLQTKSALDKTLVLKYKELQQMIVGLQEYNLVNEDNATFFINETIDPNIFVKSVK